MMAAKDKYTESQSDRPLVLIVDDERHILDALEDLLEEDFEVVTALRGQEALTQLDNYEFSVLLSDQRMPDLNGDQLLHQARNRSLATRILVSGYADFSALTQAVNNGQIYAFVSKPWKADDMKLLVSRAASHYQLTQRLKRQTELLDQLMDQFPDQIYFKDLEGRFLRANCAFSKALGKAKPEHLLGLTHQEVSSGPEGLKHHLEDLELLQGKDAVLDRNELWESPNGEPVWMSVSKQRLEDFGLVCVARDITGRKKAEERLILQAQQQQCLAELARSGLKHLELKDFCSEASKLIQRVLRVDVCGLATQNSRPDSLKVGWGYPDEARLDSWLEAPQIQWARETSRLAITPDFSKEQRFPAGASLKDWAQGSGAAVPIRGPGGEVWGVLQLLSRAPDSLGEGDGPFLRLVSQVLSLVVQNQLAQEKLEASQRQLLQSQKLEAIGRMAGGVAHDFNNVLTIIQGNAELLTPTEEADEILLATDKAAALIQQLLSFARHHQVYPRKVELNRAIQQDARLLRRLLKENIQLSVHPSEESAWTFIDPSHLTQVLANLVTNARDAIKSEGDIAITIFHPQEGRVGVEVRDNGSGMSPELLQHIFEPFFTTKPIGQGTGLGLATAYGIVSQLGGTLTVQSQLEQGTSFTITLPGTSENPEVLEPADAPKIRLPLGQGTMLVVDDEEAIVRILSRTLTQAGYKVHQTVSVQEALQMAKDLGPELDVLVTDMVMPGCSGEALATQVLEFHPQVRVLFMSGYTTSPIDELRCKKDFLSKPFSTKDLLSAVRDLLEQVD